MTASEMDRCEAEVRRLRQSMSDLVSVLALPVIWTRSTPDEIVHTLAKALCCVLALDLVYISLESASDGVAVEDALISSDLEMSNIASEVGRHLSALFGDQRQHWPVMTHARLRSKDLAFAIVQFGLGQEPGVIVAVAGRSDVPNAHDKVLLNLFANQAVVALHEARLRE